MSTTVSTFRREILESGRVEKAAALLQNNLATLIDLTLVLKQAHWNVVGPNFRSVHLQLDEIIDTVRLASDEIAERIVTIGQLPDGRSTTVSETSQLELFPSGFHQVPEMIAAVADRLQTSIVGVRSAIEEMGDLDPISEDLLIGISSQLEKHLWMVQAQEVR